MRFPCGELEAGRQLPSREEALKTVLAALNPGDAVVSTTGMFSRELFELREAANARHDSDFLVVGSMGHCSSIAFGISLAQPEWTVWALDGRRVVIDASWGDGRHRFDEGG